MNPEEMNLRSEIEAENGATMMARGKIINQIIQELQDAHIRILESIPECVKNDENRFGYTLASQVGFLAMMYESLPPAEFMVFMETVRSISMNLAARKAMEELKIGNVPSISPDLAAMTAKYRRFMNLDTRKPQENSGDDLDLGR